MRIHSNDGPIAPPVRQPHPSDHDLSDVAKAFIGFWGFCVVLGVAIWSGWLG
jgi:hypothetical protein